MSVLLALFRWTAGLSDAALVLWGARLGMALYWLLPARRRVVLTNLRLCFPAMSATEWEAMAREHFRLFGRSFLERAVLWWGAPERVRGMARIEGLSHLQALAGRPVVLFAPHFLGLDIGWSRLCMEVNPAFMYARTKSEAFNAVLAQGRRRFGQPRLLTKGEGMAQAIAAMQEGYPLYFLPDMDFRRRHSIFVPFFDVPAATLPALSRLARECGAIIVPVVTVLEADGWVVHIHESWQNFPGADIESDTRTMNQFIEQAIARAPAQYWWAHKRFKTRPAGSSKVY